MARALVFVSAILAMVAFASASVVPLVDVDTDHIGTGDVNFQGSLNQVADLENLSVHDAVQKVKIL